MNTAVGLARIALAGTLFVALASSCSPSEHEVHVSVIGGAFGSVSSDVPGWSCAEDCRFSVPGNSTVELHPQPATSATFQGWSGDCSGTEVCRLKVDKNVAIAATFAPRSFPLHVEVVGSGHGAVRLPDGSECRDNCEFSTVAGQRVHLEESADEDSYFQGWTGGYYGVTTGADIDAREGQSVSAHFARKMRLEITGINPATKGKIVSQPLGISCGDRCVSWFMPGEKVTLAPSSLDALWPFLGWSGVDCPPAACEITMDADKTIGVRFQSMFAWARMLKYSQSWQLTSSGDGGVTMALTSKATQDFGTGSVGFPGIFNFIVTRFDSMGARAFTRVFAGSSLLALNVNHMRERLDGGVSLLVTATHTGSTPPDESVDFDGHQVLVSPNEVKQIAIELDATGSVTDVRTMNPVVRFFAIASAGSTAFAVNLNRDSVTRLNPDWSSDWTLSFPKGVSNLVAGPADVAWATVPEVPADLNCVGGPVAGGALLRIESNGSCSVAWTFPDGLYPDGLQAPGGSPLLQVSYAQGFVFGDGTLPDPPTDRVLYARLRFDIHGGPVWGKSLTVIDAKSYQYVRDAVRLNDGRLLLAGTFTGVTEFSPNEPEQLEKAYLATYSDESGELLWSDSFVGATSGSAADFLSLFTFAGGRVAVMGAFTGDLDVGGGKMSSTPPLLSAFLAAYDF